jgi:hypothetical protein
MFEIGGTYKNGRIELDENPLVDHSTKVIVTFPAEPGKPEILKKEQKKGLSLSDFSFAKSRTLLKDVRATLSDDVVADRRYL